MDRKLSAIRAGMDKLRRLNTAEVRFAILLLAIPVILYCTNDRWLSSRLGDADTWDYVGHFKFLGDYSRQGDPGYFQYYQTRFPHILIGWFVYHVFSEPLAKFVLAGLY